MSRKQDLKDLDSSFMPEDIVMQVLLQHFLFKLSLWHGEYSKFISSYPPDVRRQTHHHIITPAVENESN